MSKLWGGRFSKKSNKLADHFSFSISYDKCLAKYDVAGSIAHASMLGKCKIIPKKDADKIVKGLKKIEEQILSGKFKYDLKSEDIHTNIQDTLKKSIGNAADKLHTARSRNDQIALDVRLYCREKVKQTIFALIALQKSILSFANKNKKIIVPAYTHMQSAQVILLAHQMLAYVEMFDRDIARLKDAQKRAEVMPLGSCALSGTTLPINRNLVAKKLGFKTVSANSIDGVSDRDFIIEIISALSIVAMHLSRVAEDLIIWVTSEFNFIDIDAAFCTGSSIMPHKKNPDILELIRGTTGKIYGNLSAILNLMKGLPSTYNRDMQLDKPPLFESVETTKEMLVLMANLFSGLKIKKESLENGIKNEAMFSVDLMEYLIRKGVSYRQAHDTIGKMVKTCLDKNKKISQLSTEEMQKYSKKFSSDAKKLLNPLASVTAKKSFGSTNPKLVEKQLLKWKNKLYA
ncbi:MAG: argininosuccinate lyase [Candidatus Aceula meridiana]|nr:argininosuccinate lyase [Candidatus Aceula meridiana]